MASSLLIVPTSTQRSSKAGKFNGRDGLTRAAMQVNLRRMELFWLTIALNVPVLNIWVVLWHISTNTAYWSLHKWNFWRIPPKFLENYQKILSWLQPRSRDMVPETFCAICNVRYAKPYTVFTNRIMLQKLQC